MAEPQTSKERLKEITDSIETGIRDLFQSDKYKQYLTTMSRFHRYSVNNQMLIYLQRPDATLCASFTAWKDKFERNVMKGEKGIKIIAPTPYKKKIEQEKLDPDTKLPVLDADGKVITEEKTIQIPMYKVVTTFDYAQTEGKPLPELAENLTGDVQNYDVFMEALRRSAPVPIAFEAMNANMDGYFATTDQRIAIREGMSEVQTVSAAIHEIAHSKLHNTPINKTVIGDDAPKPKSKSQIELEAESVSFSVCAYYGIATGENSFGYLASYSKDKELSELRASLEIINKTANSLITDIDRNYAAIMKERGLDKTAPEQDAPEAITPEPANTQSANTPPEPAPEISVEEAPPLTAPDNGDVPDPAISVESMNAYGYMDTDMLPLTKDRALELAERDVTVYLLHPDDTEAMAFDADEIRSFDGIFGITREDWDEIKDEYGVTTPQRDFEAEFLSNPGNSYAIYQLIDSPDNTERRFMGTEYLSKKGLEIERERYSAVYSGDLVGERDTHDRLNDLYTTFNISHPEDFTGHSLSVSDIVALKRADVVSCHYVDSWGFKELPAFLPQQNYLRNAEMSMEDDYNQLDGIVNNGKKETVAELEDKAKSGQPISLMDYVEAVRREAEPQEPPKRAEKKPSVIAMLHSNIPEKSIKTAPVKSAEREL